jgi:hypothetical protein
MSDFSGRLFGASDSLERLPFFDAGFAVPWPTGAIAGLLLVFCLLAFSRVARVAMVRGLAPIGLVLIGASIAWIALDSSSRRNLAAERLALDARAAELTVRAITPGSALACLNIDAGDAVAASCEKALFATPEATAVAVSFVAAQLTLLADATEFARRDPGYRGIITQLRHSAEADHYGIVAHVLAAREGCTADRCGAFALFDDPSRVSTNLIEHPYDLYVARHATGWPASSDPPVARSSPPPSLASVPAAPSMGIKVPGPDVFFPSAASIPPVNIMNAEPPSAHAPSPAETAGTPIPTAKAAPAQRKAVPGPQRRPADAKTDAQRPSPSAAQ